MHVFNWGEKTREILAHIPLQAVDRSIAELDRNLNHLRAEIQLTILHFISNNILSR
jgi:hypothetical protein